MRYYWIALIVLLIDQWTKYWVVTNMYISEQIPVIEDFFSITSHRNRGAAFGILQDQLWLFLSITSAVVLFLLFYIWRIRKEEPFTAFSFSLILGGALGNFIDRIRLGEVVDFFHFQYDVYHFPIFNVADASIVSGVFLLVIITLKSPSPIEKDDNVSKVGDS